MVEQHPAGGNNLVDIIKFTQHQVNCLTSNVPFMKKVCILSPSFLLERYLGGGLKHGVFLPLLGEMVQLTTN